MLHPISNPPRRWSPGAHEATTYVFSVHVARCFNIEPAAAVTPPPWGWAAVPMSASAPGGAVSAHVDAEDAIYVHVGKWCATARPPEQADHNADPKARWMLLLRGGTATGIFALLVIRYFDRLRVVEIAASQEAGT